MNIFEASNFLFGVMRVVGSHLAGPHNAVLISGRGIDGFSDDDAEAPGEKVDDADAFGAPGIVWRPWPATRGPLTGSAPTRDVPVGAEAFYVRTSEGMQPISWRDLRLHEYLPDITPGSHAFISYAGQHLLFEPVEQDAGDWSGDPGEEAPRVLNGRAVLRVPYARNGAGEATKAHELTFEPNGAVRLVHGDGSTIELSSDRIALSAPEVDINGAKITSSGEVVTASGVKLGLHTHSHPFGPTLPPVTPTP